MAQKSLPVSPNFRTEGLFEVLSMNRDIVQAQLKRIFDSRITKSPRLVGAELKDIRPIIGFQSPGVDPEISRMGFSNYLGRDRSTRVMLNGTPKVVRAALVKQILQQLGFVESERNRWVLEAGHSKIKSTDITQESLVIPGTKTLNRDRVLRISTNSNPVLSDAYGPGTVTMTLGEVFDMAAGTQIYCDGNLMDDRHLSKIYDHNSKIDHPGRPVNQRRSSGIVIKSPLRMLAYPRLVEGQGQIGYTCLAGDGGSQTRELSQVSPLIDIYSVVAPYLADENAIWSSIPTVCTMFLSLFKALSLNGVQEFYANAIGLGAYIGRLHRENPELAAYAAYVSFYCMFWAAATVQSWANENGQTFPIVYYATFGRDSSLDQHGKISGQPSFPEIFDALREQFLAVMPELQVYRFDYDIVAAGVARKEAMPALNIGILNAGNQSCQEWAADLGSGYRKHDCGAAEEYLGAHCQFSMNNRLLERIFHFNLLNQDGSPAVPVLPWARERIGTLNRLMEIPLGYSLTERKEESLRSPIEGFRATPGIILEGIRSTVIYRRPRGRSPIPAEQTPSFVPSPTLETKTPGLLWGEWTEQTEFQDLLTKGQTPGQKFVKALQEQPSKDAQISSNCIISRPVVEELLRSTTLYTATPVPENPYGSGPTPTRVLYQRTFCLVEQSTTNAKLIIPKTGELNMAHSFGLATIAGISKGNDYFAQACHRKMLDNLIKVAKQTGARTLVLLPPGCGGLRVRVTGENGMAQLMAQAISQARNEGIYFDHFYINPCDRLGQEDNRQAFIDAFIAHGITNYTLGEFDSILLSDVLARRGEAVMTLQMVNYKVLENPHERFFATAQLQPNQNIGRTCAFTTAGSISIAEPKIVALE